MAHPGVELIRKLWAGGGLETATFAEMRADLDAASGDGRPPDGVDVVPTDLGGRPAELLVATTSHPGRTVLYLHGGGYCIGSLHTHRNLAGRLALATGATVALLDYRLAPEHPHPAAVDDAVAAYVALLDAGAAADRIAIAGDSAGGGLTVATAVALRDAEHPSPGALVCLSPWVDLGQQGESHLTRADADPMVTTAGLDRMASAYLAGAPATTALASPVHADLSGLPPLMVHVGDAEVLLDDSRRLHDVASTARVEVTLTVWPEMVHVFPVFPPELLPESDEAIASIAAFLDRHLS